MILVEVSRDHQFLLKKAAQQSVHWIGGWAARSEVKLCKVHGFVGRLRRTANQ
jgi:hypothetical protein